MKKIFFATLAVAALALSCQKNEVVVENPNLNPAIEFGVYAGKAPQTKGLETVSGASVANESMGIQTEGFGIMAWYQKTTGTADANAWPTTGPTAAPNFMWNQEVTYSDGWKYSPLKYWPTMTDDRLSFFAYAPYAATAGDHGITVAAKDATSAWSTLLFEVNNDVAKQIDFVADVAIDEKHNQTGNDASARNAVNFNLKHELSRLGFTVKLDESITSKDNESAVVIKSVKLNQGGEFYKSAKYTWANVNQTGTPAADSRGTWSEPVSATEAFDFVNSFNTNLTAATKVWEVVGPAYTADALVITNNTQTPLLDTNQYFFLIPVSGGTTENGATVTIDYEIVTRDASLAAGYSQTFSTKTVSVPGGILQQGKAYSVNFTIYVDAIEVSAEVADWDKTADHPVDVPYSPDQPAA